MQVSKKNIIKYSIVGLVLSITVFIVNEVYKEEINEIFRYLSDCFLIPGILLICVYFLAWLSNDGMFDGVGYAGKIVSSMFIPNHKVYVNKDGFYKYKQEKSLKRTEKVNQDSLLVGLVFLSLAIIFYAIFLFIDK